MLGLREGSLRKLEEGERVVDSRSKKKKNLCGGLVLLGFRIEILVENSGSSFTVADIVLSLKVFVLNRQLNILLIIYLSCYYY